MSAPDAALGELFSEVTDKKLLQTVALIDRLPQRGALDDLLDPLRPRLQRLKPQRPLSLRRVLTYPLQELMVPAAAWRPGMQRLSRELLREIHTIVLCGIAPEKQAAIERSVAGHTMRDKAVLRDAGKAVWPEAAAILQAALPCDLANGDSRGRNRRQQLALAVELFGLGTPLAAVLLDLPAKPVRVLDADLQRKIAALFALLEGMGSKALELGLAVLGERLADAGVLLEQLHSACASRGSAVLIAAAGAASRRLVSELQESAEHLRRARRQPAVAVAEALVELVSTLSTLESAPADLPVDRAALKQVARKTAKAVEGHLQAIIFGEVLDGFKAMSRSDIDDEAIAAVEDAARATRKLGAAGRKLGAGGQVDLVLKAAFDDFRNDFSRSPAGAFGAATTMDRLRLIEILFGAEAAAELLDARMQKVERSSQPR